MKLPKKTLKRHLLAVPLVVIPLSFLVILVTFNLAVHRYIDRVNERKMSGTLERFEQDFSEALRGTTNPSSDEDGQVPIYHILLDERRQILFPLKPWRSEAERKRTEAIRAYYSEHESSMLEQTSKVRNQGLTYYVRARRYFGRYDDALQPIEHGKTRRYTVLVYSNITPIQEWLDVMNEVLVLLMSGFGILSLLLMTGLTRKTEGSMERLKSYIRRAGRREVLEPPEELAYEELNDVARTVWEMSRRIEEAEERQKQFFQNASHELRTPLMSIQGYGEGLRSGVMKNTEETLDVILRESARMSKLVDEILFLSKMDIQGFSVEEEKLDIKELLYECTWHIKGAADGRGIEIVHDFPAEEVYFTAGEQLLERAMTNLLSNAVRYARTKITVRCRQTPSLLTMAVEDDGEGIPASDLPHLFERFYKGKGGNTGIGLAVTSDVAKKYGGTVSVSSEPGKTVFLMEFPRERAEQ